MRKSYKSTELDCCWLVSSPWVHSTNKCSLLFYFETNRTISISYNAVKKFHTIRDKRIEAKKAIPKMEMDARKRGDPRAAMAGAMIALSGLPIDGRGGRARLSRTGGACLWDNPYNTGNYPTYSSQANCKYLCSYLAKNYIFFIETNCLTHILLFLFTLICIVRWLPTTLPFAFDSLRGWKLDAAR